MKVTAVSENAILVSLADEISESTLPRLKRLENQIEQDLGDALLDLVPSYTTLLCIYDVNQLDYLAAIARIERVARTLSDTATTSLTGREIEIPVFYDPSVGYDLERMSKEKQLDIDELIDLHCTRIYRVFAIGFLPGFGFMGSVDARLATPRQSTPRSAVAAGSVGIADIQTAVYPQQSPGGWNIIGRSPTKLFDTSNEHPALLQVGDQVRFTPINRNIFLKMGGKLD